MELWKVSMEVVLIQIGIVEYIRICVSEVSKGRLSIGCVELIYMEGQFLEKQLVIFLNYLKNIVKFRFICQEIKFWWLG